MPVLKNPKHERYAQELAKGKSQADAYAAAGYSAHRGNASALAQTQSIRARVEELLCRANEIEVKATEKAIEKLAITKERVLEEMAKIGFANMMDYVSINQNGDAYVDLSRLDRNTGAAIGEIVVEEYKDGRGEDARAVVKTKFKLLDKKGALADLAKALGMFVDRQEIGKPGDFAAMQDDDLLRYIQEEAASLAEGFGTQDESPSRVVAKGSDSRH